MYIGNIIKLDIEALREFVSPVIFDFLNGDKASVNTEVCSSDLAVDNHNQADYVLPTFDNLDAHVDALLVEYTQQLEEEELKVQACTHMKMDSTLKCT